MKSRLRPLLAIMLTLAVAGRTFAQDDVVPPKLDLFSDQPNNLNIFDKPTLGTDDFTPLGGSSQSQLKVTLDPQEGLKTGDTVTLKMKVTLSPGWYTYSLNPASPTHTTIKLAETRGLLPLGEGFAADHEPKLEFDENFGELEKYFKEVTWSRQYRVLPGASKVTLAGRIDYVTCSEQCVPQTNEFEVSADVEASDASPASAGYSFHSRPPSGDKPGPVGLTFRLWPEDARPGEKVTLTIRARLDDGWHIYAQSQEEGPGGTPSLFELQSFQGLKELEKEFKPDRAPEMKQTELTKDLTVEQHLFHDAVTWTRAFEVTQEAAETGFGIQGAYRYQVCNESKCLPPQQFSFAVGQLSAARPIDQLPFASAGSPTPLPPFDPDNFELEESNRSLGVYLVFAFLGGLILNVMPCVLPVLAIKILSFVKQSGESRSRIFQLNLAYSVGVVSVFLCLATLAMVLGLSWGGLFQIPEFNLFMACLVFVMGLSLLGVFEIPIPGLAGGGGQREGIPGAFLTGIFATFLATPCIGPFMGPVLGWSVQQPPHIIYLMWGVMGIGMAFPYLLAGMFPAVIQYLPKPGMWMVRFKELSGFALMGAVVWIISFTNTYLIVPALVMMMGLALGLWMIGNLYDHSTHINHKVTVRAIAIVATCSIVYYGYSQIPELSSTPTDVTARQEPASGGQRTIAQQSPEQPQQFQHRQHGEHSLPWQDFSEDALRQALSRNKTVLVDFSAEWCLTCKQNERIALNTAKTLELVTEREIVTLYADYTSRSPELKKWLSRFGSIGVPLTVIFPADNPNKPTVLQGTFSETTLLEKLEAAAKVPKTELSQATASE